jgi:hypothetical protein
VIDRAGPDIGGATHPTASDDAFRNITQWRVLDAGQRRENLVTQSGLGDLDRTAAEGGRELSGFLATFDLHRESLTTLLKTLLPLLLMSFISFASLFFPTALVKEKVTVAITGALSGAVLVGAINNQLGNIGYMVAVEYVFYAFFALALLCIVAVLTAERLRAAPRPNRGMDDARGLRGCDRSVACGDRCALDTLRVYRAPSPSHMLQSTQ